ncbi:short-chain dehydrogenase/reductase [Litorimonas cladophorae]|uniref:Short-chain dehydrogenase/reductase n=1 Tax=Litorimonas cladophorae TaxID=1220491 RepID=A0A918N9S0_9PROT|nr:oxidoreductase [Litorimonas cladophorae]GGX57065.1 short-chain dehydrogenase/reductase [Litorimonas cladophorae]
MTKIVLITGASSGMGKYTAKTLINEGYVVYGAARRVENMQDLVQMGGHVIGMDITDEVQIEAAVARILSEQGKIDVLVNNAGYAIYGAVEQVSIADARCQFDVNLFGLASLTQKLLPHMREQGGGHIINITSIGGKVYTPLGAWYHATKHALEGWSDCLRVETAKFGIKVTIIEPGAIQTEFSDVMAGPMVELSKGGPYEALSVAIESGNKKYYTGAPSNSPQVIADVVLKSIKSKKPKTRYAAGKMARTTLFMRRWMSDKAFDKALMSMLK